jgi:hypothetical protein
MTKFAVNIMGTFNDVTNRYTAAQVEELFETIHYTIESLKVVGVSAKQLPEDHIIIPKQKVKRSTGVLGAAVDKLRHEKNG